MTRIYKVYIFFAENGLYRKIAQISGYINVNKVFVKTRGLNDVRFLKFMDVAIVLTL